jgi:cell division septation protein DedD
MHEGSDDGFHEIQLSGKQLVFLFMATTVVSVVIFLCGVLVGRGVRADHPSTADESSAAAPAPTDTVADTAVPATEPPNPPVESPPLNYKERLESSKPLAETLKPQADRPPATREPTPEPAPQPRVEAPPVQTPPAPAQAEQPKTVAETPKAAPAATPGAPSKRGGTSRDSWVVQIVALRERQAASSIVKRLAGKGYPAFVVEPAAGAPAPVFKVQVGRYADRDEAEQVKRRLEKEEQFKPWISR